MVTVRIKWCSQHDNRVCDICQHVDGYEWTFENEIPESLTHPVYGEIWNTTIGSLAHEHYQYGKKYGLLSNCRCHVDPVSISAPELLEKLQALRDLLKEALEEGEAPDYQKGSSRKTTGEDIGLSDERMKELFGE
jgi:hypothetical protein